MIMPASYEVVIREILEKTVYVSADSPEEAQSIVEYEYYKGHIYLDSENYSGNNSIEVIGPSEEEPEF